MVGFREYDERRALPRTAEFLIAKHLLTSGVVRLNLGRAHAAASTQERHAVVR
jgi:hypothetical protein